MISRDMYAVLSHVPRDPQKRSYEEILEKSGLPEEKFENLICEAKYTGYDYINDLTREEKKKEYSLTEKGQAELELYKQMLENQKIAEKTLTVSRVAMWTAIASAIVAFLSILPEGFLCRVVTFITTLITNIFTVEY